MLHHGIHQLPYNRTILELKLVIDLYLFTSTVAYNRTILELKHDSRVPLTGRDQAYNRTILELKRYDVKYLG